MLLPNAPTTKSTVGTSKDCSSRHPTGQGDSWHNFLLVSNFDINSSTKLGKVCHSCPTASTCPCTAVLQFHTVADVQLVRNLVAHGDAREGK